MLYENHQLYSSCNNNHDTEIQNSDVPTQSIEKHIPESQPKVNNIADTENIPAKNDDVRRVLRPRENIKPAPKYGFDEAFEMSDSFHEVYTSDGDDIRNAKDPKHIVDNLVKTWLNVFGAPVKIYTDNGGEFANKKLVELIDFLTSSLDDGQTNLTCS